MINVYDLQTNKWSFARVHLKKKRALIKLNMPAKYEKKTCKKKLISLIHYVLRFLFITEPNLSLSGTSIGGQVFKIY